MELTLIERKASNFKLAEEGKVLFQMCQRVFSDIDQTQQRLKSRRGIPEIIRFGTRVEFGVSTLIKNMGVFLTEHPNIHIDYTINNDLLDLLLDDQLDLIIDCNPHNQRELKKIKLFREEYVVIVSPDYAKKQDIQLLSALKHCNILSIDKELTWWHNFVYALPTNQSIIFEKVTKIDHIRGIINAAVASLGVGFVPKYSVMNELASNQLIILFPEINTLEDTFNIYLKRKNLEKSNLKAIVSYVGTHLESWVSDTVHSNN